MANTQVRVRSPKGNVGVSDVVDAGELSGYTQGSLSGFGATSAASWTLQIGGSSTVQDVAIGRNPAGESELFVGTSATTVPFIIGGAPGTPGQSRTDALVLYKDPNTTSVVNNGLDITDYAVVAGTPATTGTQVPPNMATIRAAIPTGTLKSVSVIGYVTIAYAAGSVTTGNFVSVKAASTRSPVVVANEAERDALDYFLFEGIEIYRADTDAKEIYDGTEWLTFDTKWQTYTPVIYTNNVASTLGNGTSFGKYMRAGKMCTFKMRFALGSTTLWGDSGTQATTLPFAGNYNASYDANQPFGVCYVINSAVASANGCFEMATTGRAFFTYHQYGATPSNNNYITNTAPFSAADGDVYVGGGTYEMA